MYTSFFGLHEKPFSITPDPRYLFMSERHTEALAHLVYGVKESGGFIQLTGEVGTGKTTLVRSLLQQVPENTDVAVILNPQISRNEFLSAICEELGVPLPQSANNIKTLTSALNEYLLENHSKGRRTIVLVDEAQNLRLDVLEQVRLLTNLETTKQKLLQIILIGQPELREILSRNDMRQLAQRITGRYHLEPLSRDETAAYIDHRLKVAGAVGQIFTRPAKQELFRLSQGVPRMINVIADRAMLGAFTQELHEVTPELLRQAATEVFGKDWRRVSYGRWLAAGAVALCAIAILVALAIFNEREATPAAAAPPTPVPAPAAPGPGSTEPGISTASRSAPIPAPVIDDKGASSAGAVPAKKTAVLGEVLTRPDAATSMDNAFNTLFGLWNLEYARGNSTACQQAMKSGLNCLFQRGSLSQVRNLNRPVILTLRDQDSEQHQVVLSGLNRNTAWINIGDQVFEIDIGQLGDYWFGQYLVLWQPQINDNKQLVPGMRDGDIRWLRSSLAEIQGAPIAPMESDLFDQELESRVRAYQRERRLTADGVVGFQTQIAINSELRSFSGPLLSRTD